MFGFDTGEGTLEAPTFTRPESGSPYNISVNYIKNEGFAPAAWSFSVTVIAVMHFNVIVDQGWQE